MDLTKMNFADSIEDAVCGDRDACAFLYECTFGCFRQAAADIIGTDQVTDRLMQDIYVHVLGDLRSLQDPQMFLSRSLEVTRTAVLDYYKNHLSKTVRGYQAEPSSEDFSASVYDRNINPNAQIEDTQVRQVMHTVLDVLPAEQRICAVLWAKNFSVQQIAQKTGLSDETVCGSLNYAKQLIERRLAMLSEEGLNLYGMAPIPYFIRLCRLSESVIPEPDEAAAEKHSPQLFDSIMQELNPQEGRAYGSEQQNDAGAVPYSAEKSDDESDTETVLLNQSAPVDENDADTVLLHPSETFDLNHMEKIDSPYNEDRRKDPGGAGRGPAPDRRDGFIMDEGVMFEEENKRRQAELRRQQEADRIRNERTKKTGRGKIIVLIVVLAAVIIGVIAAVLFLRSRSQTAAESAAVSVTQEETVQAEAVRGQDPFPAALSFADDSVGIAWDL